MAPIIARLTTTLLLATFASSAFAARSRSTTAASSSAPAGNAMSTAVASSSSAAAKGSATSSAATSAASNATVALDPNVTNCFVTLPDNALTAAGLSTPFLLMPPCSMAVGTQQAFAEAAVFDPATGEISIYHPLILDAGKKAQVAPVVPTLPAGASVALWFGFNGDTLQMLDTQGLDTNKSPKLAGIKCVNGEPGITGDVFGQVSWCNTVAFFTPVNANIAAGKTTVPPLGTDNNGMDCPSARSFTVVDQDQSDNLPTQYLLLPDGSTIQDTAANRAKFPAATVINNASDEALIGDIIDPLIGCTPFKVKSLDDPGSLTSSLATQELQAGLFQKSPLAIVPTGDPDCLLTASGKVSTSKTNNYRIGVNQPLLGAANSDNGDTLTYCNNMVTFAPPFLAANQKIFTGTTTPDPAVGNNLFTFLANRYLQSFTNLVCTPTVTQPITCKLDGNAVATSCAIAAVKSSGAASSSAAASSAAATSATGKGAGSPVSAVISPSAASSAPSNGTIALSSVSASISALPTIAASSIITSISAPATTGTASINSATVTAVATVAPTTAAGSHTTYPYAFPRHHHKGGYFGAGFNPATVPHATGTNLVAASTSSAAAGAAATSPAAVASPSVSSAAAGVVATSPIAVAAVQSVPTAAAASSGLPVYGMQSVPTSFVTVTMTMMAAPASSCVPVA